MVTSVASGIVVIRTNLFNCMFHNGISGVGSDSGANIRYECSSLAYHLKHLPHHHHHLHSIHLTMVLLVMVILVTLVGL